jgi:hypothetical protein
MLERVPLPIKIKIIRAIWCHVGRCALSHVENRRSACVLNKALGHLIRRLSLRNCCVSGLNLC